MLTLQVYIIRNYNRNTILDLYFFITIFLIDRKCVFWNTNSNSWLDDGCTLLDYSEDFTQCECDHLTNFGTIMDINGNLEDNVSCIIAEYKNTRGGNS